MRWFTRASPLVDRRSAAQKSPLDRKRIAQWRRERTLAAHVENDGDDCGGAQIGQ
jgi:hypothetical protein